MKLMHWHWQSLRLRFGPGPAEAASGCSGILEEVIEH